jgi:hypothetical protein
MSLIDTVYKTKVFKRLPQDDDELWWTVRGLWGTRIPRHACCPEHTPPFKAFADAYFAREPVYVWKASRGFGGKSNQLAVLSLTEGVLLGADVGLLGGSGAQSVNIHAAGERAWEWPNAPHTALRKDPTIYYTHFANGAVIKTMTASQKSVRGPHPQRLRLDEIDEMDLDILRAAQGQPMRKRDQYGNTLIETNTVMSSTHQYPDKTMKAILDEAEEKGWPVYEWCWRCSSNDKDGWLQPDEVERKRGEISARMWETEYDLQEPSFEGRSIDTDLVNMAFREELGVFAGDPGEVVRIEDPPETVHYGRGPYVTAVDWAKEQDWTVVTTWRTDCNPWRLIAFKRFNRQSWPVMITKAEAQWFSYGGRFVHDATGLGNVVSDLLTGPRRHITDVVLSGAKRSAMFNEYIADIENGDVEMPRIEWMYNEHKYTTDEDLFGKGHPPDSFVSGALARSLKGRKKSGVAPTPATIDKESAWLG